MTEGRAPVRSILLGVLPEAHLPLLTGLFNDFVKF